MLNADPSQPNFQVPDLLPPKSLGDARLERRRKLRSIVEGHARAFESSDQAKLMDSNFQSAYRLVTSPEARGAFDLSKEPDSVRDRYGRNRFGASLLLARRLIEAGVRFETVKHLPDGVRRDHLGHPRHQARSPPSRACGTWSLRCTTGRIRPSSRT